MDFLKEKVLPVLASAPLCDHCIGRQFGNLLTGLTNKERGEALKTVTAAYLSWLRKNKDEILLDPSHIERETDALINLSSTGYLPANHELTKLGLELPEKRTCRLCNGVFTSEFFDEVIESAVNQIKESKIEFATFLVGSLIPGSLAENEEEFKARHGLAHGEMMKAELNREIGKALLERPEFSSKSVEFQIPDIIFLVDVEQRKVHPKLNPLFIYGRYQKLERGIPQSRWDCKHCRGKGCEECSFTGKRYPISVEEITAEPAIEMTEGTTAKFHGSGREDIDARMLGKGRPFVLEVVEPKKRFIDLKVLEKKINESTAVKVILEGFATREIVRMIKVHDPGITKKYHALVQLDKPASEITRSFEEIQESLIQSVIHQRTPLRVSHRRADLVRKRRLMTMTITPVIGDDHKLEMNIHCEGGLYVKELISGDEGRTVPSFSELAGTAARIIELDVVEVDEKIDHELLNHVEKPA
ncbi:MAG: tRNA pseudouridine(54/55) synthase Pus10 [Candidatus Odinarchaeota archaeon]